MQELKSAAEKWNIQKNRPTTRFLESGQVAPNRSFQYLTPSQNVHLGALGLQSQISWIWPGGSKQTISVLNSFTKRTLERPGLAKPDFLNSCSSTPGPYSCSSTPGPYVMKVKASFRSLNPPQNLTRAPRDDHTTLTWGLGLEILCNFFLRWIREGKGAPSPYFLLSFFLFKKTPFSRFNMILGPTFHVLHSIQNHNFSKGNFNENSIANSIANSMKKPMRKNHEIPSQISMEISNEKIFRNFFEKSIGLSWNFKIFATFVSNLYDGIVIRKLVEPCHSQQISCTPPSLFDQILIRFWKPACTKCVTPVLCWFMLHFWNQKFAIYSSCIFLPFFCGWWNAFMRH